MNPEEIAIDLLAFQAAIQSLSVREWLIVRGRLRGNSLAEIAASVGVTRQRIVQLLANDIKEKFRSEGVTV